ncbi:MAG: Asp-tRNA(Asn)/Glu-tRNA(Gln) amidotransferase subunit GatA [Oscillospiraceae bacterium]|nr:Asp-tRNA(Asn)/Glu-tRNA(Gln) amidotransferase subunit GatA [Oscillospiraceae bacterium]
MDIREMTALEIGRRIKNKELSCEEAVSAVLGAIDATDGKLGAYISVQKEEALAAAYSVQKRLDAGEELSPLAGVPVSIKDNICVKDVPATAGAKMLENFRPVYNATVVEKLEAAGMIPIGKLNMDEFGMGSTTESSIFGPTKNPWNLERVAGGSSGGCAAAVASGSAALAIGSDTGGSIRQPSAFCGVTCIKPTYGSVSRYGLMGSASSFDTMGPMGKDIRDCAAALKIMSGPDRRDSTCVIDAPFDFNGCFEGGVGGMTIGLPENYLGDGLSVDTREAILNAAKTFESMGARVERFTMPMVEYAVPAFYIIACAEGSSNLSAFDGIKYGYRSPDAQSLAEVYVKSRSEAFGFEAKKRIMLGSFVLSSGYYDAYYNKALQVRGLVVDAFKKAHEKYDFILSPVTPSGPYRLGESLKDPQRIYLADVYTVPVNLAGLPAVALPCGQDSDGLPVGMQLIGRRFGEPTILRAADAFQQKANYHTRRCPL